MKQYRKDYRESNKKLGDQVIDFLLDQEMEGIVDGRFNKKKFTYIYKHEIDDRFFSIYMMESGNVFISSEMKYMGIYDKEDKVIFNASYILEYYLKDQDRVILSKDTLSSIRESLQSEINDSIRKKGIIERKKLFEQYVEAIQNIEDYRIQNIADYAANDFIRGEIVVDEKSENELIEEFCNNVNYLTILTRGYKEVVPDEKLLESFYHHDEIVHELSSQYYIDEEIREYLAQNLYINQRKYDEVMKIINNENKKYQSLYDRRKMIAAIKDHTGVNITIVINYDGDTCEFKFDRNKLVNFLSDSKRNEAWEFGKSYEPVKKFLLEHKQGNVRKDEFDFDKIQEIRYGRNTLYSNNLIQQRNRSNRKKEELVR